jgi:hypothetical protein
MVKNITFDEIVRYSKIEIKHDDFTNNTYMKIITEKLKLCNWNNAGSRFHYNNFIFLGKLFDIEINKKEIILDKTINIPIKEQDYFHILFVSKLYSYKHKKEKYFKKNWFLEDGYVNINFIDIEKNIITHCFKKKLYRVDTYIKLYDNYYLVLEYFEKKHLNADDEDLRREQNRIYQLMYNNQDESIKIAKVIIMWHMHLDDQEYIDNIIKQIYKLVHTYKNINDEKAWCVDIIDNEVIHSRELSEQLYDGYLDNNKPFITFQAINKIVKWKDENSREECFAEFKVYIEELEQFRNNKNNKNDEDIDFLDYDESENDIQKQIYYEENKLTYNGLFEFFPCIQTKYLIDIKNKSIINQLMKNITNGFISGIKERYEKLSKLSNNNIIGLNDI